ncbi:MAG: nucleoside triphosphate pyrophosphohydrolase [Zetaproteobacteria bacterium CG12_big_fil_rev_8_21_14_0_65_54_13]|nr:MAG: nucleoside triphosphate pyrophosphohydrolase [Zetaproteobacteria bacterium CG23_combo_of_CG06-09_8_20_14_all_54_7]PIW49675.1 MAG: nucleoside triphosphate pyrophosphohydrolase [Zetaproteobacteria bacterium CG12_big_fil_rev_8_21_14_0_65_54_13]PIX53975.1 MAG: nucleoside triphosphate pyrophosphohydrolase [Zetaproteobacteria bacterium CG_4_10_14_3_um_filter_54_28]PJA28153.1 MAG: nucleoside triphosphate pyrophosphohydrolase [Zetaproteobacteria bacterium CG_4_9_14_3_um_filter_54_145]
MPDRISSKDNHYDKLRELMRILRRECPWDREQTLLSLRRYTLEEVHEVIEAIDSAENGDWLPLKSELGDLLLQVVFYARIAEEADAFNFGDVIDTLIDRMIYRHPHVFDQAKPHDLNRQWDELKDAEHRDRISLMDGIPPLPALKYAQKQQQRAARVGFDWQEAADVMLKMREEMDELEVEINSNAGMERLEDEFGDVLFTLANLARKLDLDAELCLMRTNRKFARRFRGMEDAAASQAIPMDQMDLDAQETLYQAVKAQQAMESSNG